VDSCDQGNEVSGPIGGRDISDELKTVSFSRTPMHDGFIWFCCMLFNDAISAEVVV
jgi:hypothetical protein